MKFAVNSILTSYTWMISPPINELLLVSNHTASRRFELKTIITGIRAYAFASYCELIAVYERTLRGNVLSCTKTFDIFGAHSTHFC